MSRYFKLRMDKGVEGFGAELEVSAFRHVEGLIERGREVDTARAYKVSLLPLPKPRFWPPR
jgi:hypothetical protein